MTRRPWLQTVLPPTIRTVKADYNTNTSYYTHQDEAMDIKSGSRKLNRLNKQNRFMKTKKLINGNIKFKQNFIKCIES